MINKILFVLLFVFSSFTISAREEVFPEVMTVVKTEEQCKQISTIATPAIEYLKQAQSNTNITRMVFVRHGESTSNEKGAIAGRTIDADLTEKGCSQAREIGIQLTDTPVEFSVVYTSPMIRTKKTAAFILSMLKPVPTLPSYQDERLHEKWVGSFEGASQSEYAQLMAKEMTEIPLLESFLEKYQYKPYPDFESIEEVNARVIDFIRDAAHKHPGQNLLIGAHGGLMKCIFITDSAYRGYDVEYRRFEVINCALLVVEVNNDTGDIEFKASSGIRLRN